MKKWKWRKYGMKLELAVASWIAKDVGFPDVTWDTVGTVDVYFADGLIQIECKRLKRTQFVTISWLWENVVKRFREDALLKILVVTKDCWNMWGEALLRQHGIKVIVVGDIDRKRELERAKKIFIDEFLDCLRELEAQLCLKEQ